jgi:hypothetical protein
VKDEKGDLVADPYSTVARWRNHFCHLLNVHVVNLLKPSGNFMYCQVYIKKFCMVPTLRLCLVRVSEQTATFAS